MPWSIFTDGGGPGAAYTWAVDLLNKIGAPLTKGNEQFVFDWEVSEGGGGRYNPLNQGTDPSNAGLTTTGNQYGGGAADYKSWNAGLQGAADYLAMPAFAPVADALRSNQPQTARADLIASPWAASHYGGGNAFSSEALPGQQSALPAAGGPANSSSSSSSPTSVTGAISGLTGDLKSLAIIAPVVLAGGALVVFGFIRMTGAKDKAENAAGSAAKIGALAV